MSHAPTRRRARRALLPALIALALVAAACSSDDDAAQAPATTEGEAVVLGSGDQGYEATITRTTGDVPHIVADDLRGVVFGQGWASGEDRACDLADQLVKIRGERARWYGAGEDDAYLDSDIGWRALGLVERAQADWDEAGEDVRQLMTAFADGWNAHLAEVGVDGLAGWCAGEPWVEPITPVDLYAYARAVALQASGARLLGFIPSAQPPGAAPDAEAPTDDASASPDAGSTSTEPSGTAPATTAPATTAPGGAATPTGEAALGALPEVPAASNGWAIGTDRSTSGGGMLLANPHFPWDGELRFWESQLTIPGQLDIYGVQLSGLPGIGIGFTDTFGWTHTVSAGNRFTAYRLELVPGDPTSYVYGDETRQMTSEDLTIEVLGDDGTLDEVTHTVWSSHYGPIIDFPGFGWTDAATITYRDANIDNAAFIDQYLGMTQATSLDELIAVHRDVTGVPLFNTIATSNDGRAWYADTSATPNLSAAAIAGWQQALTDDPITAIAYDNGAVLLDGSDPVNEWVDAPGARSPGLVPFDAMPMAERADYLFNANDSFWLPHATFRIEGDYSPLHGLQGTARSPRTRENAVVLGDSSDADIYGDDGTLDLDELAGAALHNEGYTARALRDEVVARCQGAAPIQLEPLLDEDDGSEVLPAGQVDIGPACDALAGWDGIYDLDRVGPAVWRELMTRFDREAFEDAGPLWGVPFDPERAVETPAELAPAPPEGPDPILVDLARSVQVLDATGIAVDAPLGEVQVADRDGTIVPIHGGDNSDGTTNIVGWGTGWSTLDPELQGIDATRGPDGSSLRTIDGDTRWWVNNGSSFVLALQLDPEGGPPQAKAFLTYGNPEDRDDPTYVEATQRFSAKDWRDVAWTEDQVAAQQTDRYTVRG